MCNRYIRGKTETEEKIGQLINERKQRINYYAKKADILSSFKNVSKKNEEGKFK